MIGEPDADRRRRLGRDGRATVRRRCRAFKETAIEDTTTVQSGHAARSTAIRPVEDLTFSVKGERPLETSIAEYGFSAEDAKKASRGRQGLLGLNALGDRYVVGLRGYRPDRKQTGYKLVQLSINAPDRYIGTIALADNGDVRRRAPIHGSTTTCRNIRRTACPRPQAQNFRLLDAIYSTATRNNVPSAVTGEAIMLVSKVFDLSALATKDDRLTLVFAKSAGDEQGNAGHVLYVADPRRRPEFRVLRLPAARPAPTMPACPRRTPRTASP